jgi:hypothetical protein
MTGATPEFRPGARAALGGHHFWTVEQILADVSQQMDMEDDVLAYLSGRPTRLKHPRKTLRAWLHGRR